MHAHAHGIGAQFYYGEDAGIAHARAQRLERNRDFGRMMREVVIDRDAVYHAAHFETTLDRTKARDGADRLIHLHLDVLRSDDGGERILHVVCAEQIPRDLALCEPSERYAKARGIRRERLRRPAVLAA